MTTKALTVIKKHDEGQQAGRENQEFIGKTLVRHRRSVFATFPDFAQRKMIKNHIRQELKTGFDFRLQKLALELDTVLHQVREESNHTLVTGKARLRKERMEFFANSYHEVVEQLNSLSERFLDDLDRRYVKLEKFKNARIREREEKRLDKSVDDFLDTLDQLVDEYRHIIAEHVG